MRRLLLLATLPLVLMACGSDNNTPTIVSLAGTWNLSTANGTALPFTISNTGGTKIELLSASVVVAATGTFAGTEQIRTTVGSAAPVTTTSNLAGTIAASGTLVTVVITGSGTVTGTLTGTTQFSYIDPTTGATFVFVKQ